jgi:hypothetical protein
MVKGLPSMHRPWPGFDPQHQKKPDFRTRLPLLPSSCLTPHLPIDYVHDGIPQLHTPPPPCPHNTIQSFTEAH